MYSYSYKLELDFFSIEHISGGYFVCRQLLMKGFCDRIGDFYANKTVKNSENPILRGFQ